MEKTNNKLITRKEMFTRLLAIEDVANDMELVAKIEHELKALEEKSTKAKKSADHTGIMNEIKQALREIGEPVTISALMKSSPVMGQYSNQRLNSIIQKMVVGSKNQDTTNELVRIVKGKQALYTLVELAPTEEKTDNEE